MSYGSYDGRQPGTTEAREAARERAREIRDQQRKKERRGRTIRNGSIIVGTLAVVAIVAFVLTNFAARARPRTAQHDERRHQDRRRPDRRPHERHRPRHRSRSRRPRTPTTSSTSGSTSTTCARTAAPSSRRTATSSRPCSKEGAATVEIHPIALLTTKSAGDQYSLRAANAAACVAEFSPDSFFKFHDMLFVGQPKEGEAGFDDAELIDRAQRAGATNIAKITECVEGASFLELGEVGDGAGPQRTAARLGGRRRLDDADHPRQRQAVQVQRRLRPERAAQFIVQAAGQSDDENPTPTPSPSVTPAP